MQRKNVIVSIVGARPQFIKCAPVEAAIAQSSSVRSLLYHTGQHYDADMSDIFFEELQIAPPHRHLGIGGGAHGEMTGRMLAAIEAAILEDKPDAVLVYGDTNSTLAGALAGVKLHLPIFHVEAGLRSFNRRMPEEINRVVTDHVSSLLFCPTRLAAENLKAEGISVGVSHVGDVMYDATVAAAERARAKSSILQRLGVTDGEFVLCTIHRAENTDDPARLLSIVQYIERVGEGRPIVFPVHPRTKKALSAAGVPIDRFFAVPPVGYLDMQRLLAGSALVCTDSGGLQKEAYFLRRPCITLRDETEWVETIEAGWNRLWTTPQWNARSEISDYGSGNSAGEIVSLMEDYLD